ncbi:MAG: STAS domain-containing protein [Clostridia bacterium]|nr:STAS domain-containing protein [Clostridia bacterium]
MNEVQIERKDNALLITLSGEIHSGNADEFREAVEQAYGASPADICFSCAELSFIDSTTLGTLVKIRKMLLADGKKVVLEHLQPNIKKLFLICKLDSIMEIRQ